MAHLFKMYEQADYQYLSILGIVFLFLSLSPARRTLSAFQSKTQGVKSKNPSFQNFFYLFPCKYLQIYTITKNILFFDQMRKFRLIIETPCF